MTKKSIKKKNSRPSAYNEEISARICSLIMDGHSLRSICAGQDMPSIQILYCWLHERREFAHQYATAREASGDEFAYQILKIAEQTNKKNYKAVRIRIDGMKWLASKMSPKHWGDKHAITHIGAFYLLAGHS